MLGANVNIASPEGYELPASVVSECVRVARGSARVQQFRDPRAAVMNADAVYTDVWTSMGQEAETTDRKRTFAPYQVNTRLMGYARRHALFMHCLPAHRGQEVTADVLESDRSVVFDQAENRLHVQKALLVMLLAPTANLAGRGFSAAEWQG
jgi:ornithine carbamoyltransferase